MNPAYQKYLRSRRAEPFDRYAAALQDELTPRMRERVRRIKRDYSGLLAEACA